MAQVILLGTGAALCDETREHTYMVVHENKDALLIDCAGSPVQRLIKAGVALDYVNHLILTHHHPDHMYGLSVFLLDLWLAGRNKVLHIYGLAETLRAARAMMRAFEWGRWFEVGFFPVTFHRVAPNCPGSLIVTREFSISTTTTTHLLPTIAVRVESNASGKSITYSSDTQVCDAVVALARGSDTLIHEATSLNHAIEGHTSARQAGAQAKRAGVKRLVLVHLPPHCDTEKWRAAALKTFDRQVAVGKDFARFEF